MQHHLPLSLSSRLPVCPLVLNIPRRVRFFLSAQITPSFFPRSQNITTNVHIFCFVHKVLSLIGETAVVPKDLKKRERRMFAGIIKLLPLTIMHVFFANHIFWAPSSTSFEAKRTRRGNDDHFACLPVADEFSTSCPCGTIMPIQSHASSASLIIVMIMRRGRCSHKLPSCISAP